MKPTFALDLTEDRIGLLHRTPKGWLSVGEVAFDAPDLTEALDYLRKTALGLSPMGIATKVVIPNGQILYVDLQVSGTAKEEKRKQIRAALEGRTPYALDDLVFDWSGKGSAVKVAVVPRETLAEAEAFATQHRFNPVSFVARPEAGSFVGEPWFGVAAAAAGVLAEGETVDRDRDAIVLLHRELPKSEVKVVAPEAAVVEDMFAGDVAAEEVATEEVAVVAEPLPAVSPLDDGDEPLPGLEEALMTQVQPAPAAKAAPMQLADPREADLDFDSLAAALAEDPATPDVVIPEPAMAEPAVAKPEVAEPAVAEVVEAPFAHVTDQQAFGDADDAFAAAADPAVDDDLPPPPPPAAMMAFASRRAAVGPALLAVDGGSPPKAFGKPVEDLPALPRNPPLAAPRPPVTAGARSNVGKGFAGLVTAPTIPGTRKVKGKSVVGMTGDPMRPGLGGGAPKTLVKPGGTFGARSPQRGKPRYLGLILTGLLLIFLAVVAAYTSLYMSSNASSQNDTAVVDAAVPGVDDEMLADMQDPDGMTGPLPEAATGAADLALADPVAEGSDVNLSPDIAPDDPAAVAQATPVQEPAPATAVTTDLAAAQPLSEAQDEIFLAAMDAPPPALDALALPAPPATVDAPPDTPMLPPPFGTVYQFDANGLLQPTAGGILSPEGVMLIAGKPPIVPPVRNDAAVAAALAASTLSAAATVEPTGVVATDPIPPVVADPALASFRPKLRPETIAPVAKDGATLESGADAAFASLRPLPRPDTVVAAAGAKPTAPADLGAQAASLTAQAEATLAAAASAEAANPSIVAISMRPAARPRDLSRAVEAAVAAAVREPAPEAIASAEPAPGLKPDELDEVNEPDTNTPAPKIPTKANVAKQATFVNAINLSKINLIGVYGTQSKRYALIRQSNGRYKKVSVGDRIDGGTVQAITDSELRYQKGGRLVALKMPKA